MKLLAINAGSSSLKFKLYNMPEEEILIYGYIDKIGEQADVKTIINGQISTEIKPLKNHEEAVKSLIDILLNYKMIDNLEDIMSVCEGVMVARGDLGEEVPISLLPVYQKLIIKKARELGRICIVATEMLESMKNNSRPTRAEVTDVANAVLDGTDAIMLSGETTVGKYPIETVSYMASIARDAEDHALNNFEYLGKIGRTEGIAACAVDMTKYVKVEAIACASVSGFTARFISNFRPNCPIMATCTTDDVARSLALNYGVYTSLVPYLNDSDEMLKLAISNTREYFNISAGKKIIITGGMPLVGKSRITNFMKIEEIN